MDNRGQSPEVKAALHGLMVDNKIGDLERENELLREQLETVKKRVDAWDADRNKFLIWGIMALGAAVFALGTYIWTHATGIGKP